MHAPVIRADTGFERTGKAAAPVSTTVPPAAPKASDRLIKPAGPAPAVTAAEPTVKVYFNKLDGSDWVNGDVEHETAKDLVVASIRHNISAEEHGPLTTFVYGTKWLGGGWSLPTRMSWVTGDPTMIQPEDYFGDGFVGMFDDEFVSAAVAWGCDGFAQSPNDCEGSVRSDEMWEVRDVKSTSTTPRPSFDPASSTDPLDATVFDHDDITFEQAVGNCSSTTPDQCEWAALIEVDGLEPLARRPVRVTVPDAPGRAWVEFQTIFSRMKPEMRTDLAPTGRRQYVFEPWMFVQPTTVKLHHGIRCGTAASHWHECGEQEQISSFVLEFATPK